MMVAAPDADAVAVADADAEQCRHRWMMHEQRYRTCSRREPQQRQQQTRKQPRQQRRRLRRPPPHIPLSIALALFATAVLLFLFHSNASTTTPYRRTWTSSQVFADAAAAAAAAVDSAACQLPTQADVLLRFNLKASEQRESIQMEVVPSTINKLVALRTKIALVSIIGPYRTGKSTLLNQMLPPQVPRNVFSVGHTVQPHTEEVSIYILPPCSAVAQSALPAGTSLVFVDTPGLFAPNRAPIFDSQLLAILNLISSVVMYNNFGVIKRGEVEQLSEAIEAAFALSYFDDRAPAAGGTTAASTSNSSRIDRPHLIWCMQNLQVELKDRDNNDISSKRYVQAVLNEIDASGNGTTHYTSQFNNFFHSLDSFGMPFPAERFRDSNRINELPDEEFSQEYRDARQVLRAKVMSVIAPKQVGAVHLDGAMLADLVETWTQNVNIPMAKTRSRSASQLLRHIYDRELSRTVELYRSHMRKLTFPLDDDTLRKAHTDAVSAALKSSNRADSPDFAQALAENTDDLFTTYVQLNENSARVVLDEKRAEALKSYERGVDELQLPCVAQAVLDVENAVTRDFAEGVQTLRSAVASLVGQAEADLTIELEKRRNDVLMRSAIAYKDAIFKEFVRNLELVKLPAEDEAILAVGVQAEKAWHDTVVERLALPESAVATLTETLTQLLNDRVTLVRDRNAQMSTERCMSEAVLLSHEILTRASNWMSSPEFQSRAAFEQVMDTTELSATACRGDSANSTRVRAQFDRARRSVLHEIEQRVAFAQLWLGASLVLAIVLGLRVRKAHVSGRHKTAGMVMPGRSSPSSATSSLAFEPADRWLAIASACAAVGLVVLMSYVPDVLLASPMLVWIVFALVAALITASGLVAWSFVRQRRSSHHE